MCHNMKSELGGLCLCILWASINVYDLFCKFICLEKSIQHFLHDFKSFVGMFIGTVQNKNKHLGTAKFPKICSLSSHDSCNLFKFCGFPCL